MEGGREEGAEVGYRRENGGDVEEALSSHDVVV